MGSQIGFRFDFCQGCGIAFTHDNNSEAHVIPNALGGNLKPKGIICRRCNGKLDDVADNELIDAFAAWPTLLDLPRDRGENPARRIPTRNGKTVRLEADGSLTRADIVYDVVAEGEERHVVTIGAGDMRTLRICSKGQRSNFLF